MKKYTSSWNYLQSLIGVSILSKLHTYSREMDLLRFKCHEVIDMIYAAIASAHCPNIEAVAKKLASET